jgi:hypothetical protein
MEKREEGQSGEGIADQPCCACKLTRCQKRTTFEIEGQHASEPFQSQLDIVLYATSISNCKRIFCSHTRAK